jgi:hypothetical protein
MKERERQTSNFSFGIWIFKIVVTQVNWEEFEIPAT